MGEFFVRVATPADVDRLQSLFDEHEGESSVPNHEKSLEMAELRRATLVSRLRDPERAVLVAYSGIRAVGFLQRPGDTPYVAEGWRGLGVEEELLAFRS